MRTGRGFSVIELVIVVAVLGVLLAIGYMLMPRDGFAVNQAASGLARNVQLARFEAIRENNFVGLRIPAGSDTYEFFRGRTYDPDVIVLRRVQFGDQATPGVRITTVVPESGTIVFDPRGMVTSLLGTDGMAVTLRAGTQERTVRITQQGRASVE